MLKAPELDAQDPVAEYRSQFKVDDNLVYLDGNSLGPLPLQVTERMNAVIHHQWGSRLICSWNESSWLQLPTITGEKIARLIGSAPGQVVCTDSTSVNLFKLLVTALQLRPRRVEVLTQVDNFPTDLYMVQGLSQLLGERRVQLRAVPREELRAALGERTAVVMLTHVDFRTGELHDMADWTKAAHDAGAHDFHTQEGKRVVWEGPCGWHKNGFG